MADYDMGYRESKEFWQEDSWVEKSGDVYYLPHQCDGWKIGDIEDVEELIADLKNILTMAGLHKASRSDVLEWLGWEECENILHDNLQSFSKCGTCGGRGLVPPASQVEAAAKAMFRAGADMEANQYPRRLARAALIAAMKGVDDE